MKRVVARRCEVGDSGGTGRAERMDRLGAGGGGVVGGGLGSTSPRLSGGDFLCLGGKTMEKADLLEVEAILAASTFIFPYKIY